MRFHTKRYDIKKLNPEEFDTARYEVNLNDGYKFSDGSHLVSFDKVVEVMHETGHNLPSLYRETSEGGLAKKIER